MATFRVELDHECKPLYKGLYAVPCGAQLELFIPSGRVLAVCACCRHLMTWLNHEQSSVKVMTNYPADIESFNRFEFRNVHAFVDDRDDGVMKGPLLHWPATVESSEKSGFNFLHFTPVQQLGESGSCYSICDQRLLGESLFAEHPELKLEPAQESKLAAIVPPTFQFHPDKHQNEKFQNLYRMISYIEMHHGTLSMVDIVLNHTASNSPWLERHPDSGFNLCNSPHLKAAFTFDEMMVRLSKVIAARSIAGESEAHGREKAASPPRQYIHAPDLGRDTGSDDGLSPDGTETPIQPSFTPLPYPIKLPPGITIPSPVMNSPEAVQSAVNFVRAVGLPWARLWEFYVVDVDAVAEHISTCVTYRSTRHDERVTSETMLMVAEESLRSHPASTVESLAARMVKDGTVYNDGSGDRFGVQVHAYKLVRRLNELVQQSVEESGLFHEGMRLVYTGAPLSEDSRGPCSIASKGSSRLTTSQPGLRGALVQFTVRLLHQVNVGLYQCYDADMDAAFGAMLGTAKHTWLGEFRGERQITERFPLTWAYFTRMNGHVFANNGFIWGGDPLIDFTFPVDDPRKHQKRPSASSVAGVLSAQSPTCFASQSVFDDSSIPTPRHGSVRAGAAHAAAAFPIDNQSEPRLRGRPRRSASITRSMSPARSRAGSITPSEVGSSSGSSGSATPLVMASTPYMRRDIVIWGDCVKLRYGDCPQDSPWLWKHMERYIRGMAHIFHAVRIDNAHGTPLHVAAHMVDMARQVRHNLFVCAELFTGSQETDVQYVESLGIHALIREAMQAHSPAELGGMARSYGGSPVGSLRRPFKVDEECVPGASGGDATTLSVCAVDDTPRSLRSGRPGPLHRTSSEESVGDVFEGLQGGGKGFGLGQSSRHLNTGSSTSLNAITTGSIMRTASGTEIADDKGIDSGASTPVISSPGHHYPLVRRPSLRRLLRTRSVASDVLANGEEEGWTVQPLLPSPIPVIFYDCTHDNETPYQKRHPNDALPNAAMVSAAACAIGSVRGYDDLVPENPSVVDDYRLYTPMKPHTAAEAKAAPMQKARCLLNSVHQFLAREGYTEMHVDHTATSGPYGANGADVHTISRYHPYRMDAFVVITRSAHNKHATEPGVRQSGPGSPPLHTIVLEGYAVETLMAARLEVNVQPIRSHAPKGSSLATEGVVGSDGGKPAVDKKSRDDGFYADHDTINGFEGKVHLFNNPWGTETWREIEAVLSGDHGAAEDASSVLDSMLRAPDAEQLRTPLGRVEYVMGRPGSPLADVAVTTKVHLSGQHFIPGSVLIFRVAASHSVSTALANAHEPQLHTKAATTISGARQRELRAMFAARSIDMITLNRLLFRCDAEERDDTHGHRGVYGVPGMGQLPWAGLAGVEAELRELRLWNNMGSPLLENMRQGRWLMDYILTRASELQPLVDAGVVDWMSERTQYLDSLPAGRRPQVIDAVLKPLFQAAVDAVFARMSEQIQNGGPFVKALALTSIALIGHTQSAPLLDFSMLPEVEPDYVSVPSLAAGAPHFTTGFMRNWGRDTFIALRGMAMVTGRFAFARETILSYASVIRHGLIPNLMDGGRNPRYNARDATWWFLQSVQDYCLMAPDGLAILAEEVGRRFPTDDPADQKRDASVRVALHELVYEIMSRHAGGINFTEWNAGTAIDSKMKEPGFHISIRLDPETGLLKGGNEHNCGTWMDKMGESDQFGTMGVPATPRDGAPIEITGLLYSTLVWLDRLSTTPHFPHENVTLEDGQIWTWAEWSNTLKQSFEHQYFIPTDPGADDRYTVDKHYVNRRGIYKDTVGASQTWCDYQLRCNLVVALAVAPGLFDATHARVALRSVEHYLLGESNQLGIKTLDPSDWAFRGNYDNDDNTTRETARGWNYHQGPEWVWPFGYYLRARIHFPRPEHDPKLRCDGMESMRRWMQSVVANHRRHILRSKDMGLPELTNRNGAHCHHSCSVQAWSSSTLLDALFDLEAAAHHSLVASLEDLGGGGLSIV